MFSDRRYGRNKLAVDKDLVLRYHPIDRKQSTHSRRGRATLGELELDSHASGPLLLLARRCVVTGLRIPLQDCKYAGSNFREVGITYRNAFGILIDPALA
jgi:hypothetical protein